jgi:hypothetical protein
MGMNLINTSVWYWLGHKSLLLPCAIQNPNPNGQWGHHTLNTPTLTQPTIVQSAELLSTIATAECAFGVRLPVARPDILLALSPIAPSQRTPIISTIGACIARILDPRPPRLHPHPPSPLARTHSAHSQDTCLRHTFARPARQSAASLRRLRRQTHAYQVYITITKYHHISAPRSRVLTIHPVRLASAHSRRRHPIGMHTSQHTLWNAQKMTTSNGHIGFDELVPNCPWVGWPRLDML